MRSRRKEETERENRREDTGMERECGRKRTGTKRQEKREMGSPPP